MFKVVGLAMVDWHDTIKLGSFYGFYLTFCFWVA